MTRVFVIMGGDYPDAVFTSFQAATDYCEQQKQKHIEGTRPVHWRVYSFDLQGTAPGARPGILRDDDAHERQWSIDAGLAWRAVADATVVYIDRGISKGMEYGIQAARSVGLPVEMRTIELKAAQS